MSRISRTKELPGIQPGYSLEEHRHRFAAWAAGRAASVAGNRFSVNSAAQVIAGAGLRSFLDDPERLPDSSGIDAWHRKHRKKVITTAQKAGFSLTHGTAAKLINVYFKAGLMGASGLSKDRMTAFHPPVDRLLLAELGRNNMGDRGPAWKQWKEHGWSNFDSKTYEDVIRMIRKIVGTQPMWMIESYWKGHQ